MTKKSAVLALTALLAAGTAASAGDSLGDRFHYFGIMGNRYDHTDVSSTTDNSFVGILNLGFKINDNMSFESCSEIHKMYHHQDETWSENGDANAVGSTGYSTPNDQSAWSHFFEQAYVDAKFAPAKTEIKAGQFAYFPGYGLTHGDYLYVQGAQVAFNPHERVRAVLTGGQNTQFVPAGTYESMGYFAGEAIINVLPKSNTNVKISYQKNQSNRGLAPQVAYQLGGKLYDKTYIGYWENGFDTRLPMDLSFEAAYIKSDYDTDNKGIYAKLQYKGAIPFVPNTFDVYAAYHKLEANSIMYNDVRYYSNMKGVRLGAHYTPMDCVLITAWYDIQEYINAGSSNPGGSYTVAAGKKDNFFRLQVDFFFK
nr:hypothetical protein [uncultured Holophaga sp.]